jgi:hypothetical protein
LKFPILRYVVEQPKDAQGLTYRSAAPQRNITDRYFARRVARVTLPDERRSDMKTAMIMALAIASMGASLGSSAAVAASRDGAGPWRLSEIGGKIGCTVALIDRGTLGGGHDVLSPGVCQRAFPPLKDLSIWRFDERGSLIFSDPERRHVAA